MLKRLEPNIRSSLRQTPYQERDDLKQELRYTVYEKTIGYPLDEIPGFKEFEKKTLNGFK
ncbi:hypothetical protein FZW96_17965 [Bacillus sp. BGMRC 2118]|nr:hypothetical protein FZW96_17965 [Bacillus sp. BGMRC 2118]